MNGVQYCINVDCKLRNICQRNKDVSQLFEKTDWIGSAWFEPDNDHSCKYFIAGNTTVDEYLKMKNISC